MDSLPIEVGHRAAHKKKPRDLNPNDEYLVVGYSGGSYVVWHSTRPISLLLASAFVAAEDPIMEIPPLPPSMDRFLNKMGKLEFRPSRSEVQQIDYVPTLCRAMQEFSLLGSTCARIIDDLFAHDRRNIPQTRHAIMGDIASGKLRVVEYYDGYEHDITMARLAGKFVFERPCAADVGQFVNQP